MIHIAIVDDDDTDAANTTSLISRYYESDRSAYHITRFTDGDTSLDTYRAGFDALFLDIEMPGIDGLETAHRLREIDDHVVLVFTTKMAQYAAIGYDVDAVGYLVKPIDYFGFALKMRKVEDLVAKRQGVTIPLTVGTGTQFLSSHDVRYIEVLATRSSTIRTPPPTKSGAASKTPQRCWNPCISPPSAATAWSILNGSRP